MGSGTGTTAGVGVWGAKLSTVALNTLLDCHMKYHPGRPGINVPLTVSPQSDSSHIRYTLPKLERRLFGANQRLFSRDGIPYFV